MKHSRHQKILNIITSKEVTTQDQLVAELNEQGVQVTQATISRDIKDLKIVKVMGSNGEYKYTQLVELDKNSVESLMRFIKEVLLSVDSSDNMVCLKTVDGSAGLVGKTIDSLNDSNIVGTISGNNTVFVLVKTKEYIPVFLKKFEKLM